MMQFENSIIIKQNALCQTDSINNAKNSMKKWAGFTLIEDSDQSMNCAFDCLWLKVQVPFY